MCGSRLYCSWGYADSAEGGLGALIDGGPHKGGVASFCWQDICFMMTTTPLLLAADSTPTFLQWISSLGSVMYVCLFFLIRKLKQFHRPTIKGGKAWRQLPETKRAGRGKSRCHSFSLLLTFERERMLLNEVWNETI